MDRIVLKASAGTGKTYRLSIEYIVSLLKGESYQDILVMTFTKKATGEIKERVLEFLKTLAYTGEDSKKTDEREELYNSLKSNIEIKNEKRKKEESDLIELSYEKLVSIQNEIGENSDKLKIYTIDGFISTIFKGVVAPYLKLDSYSIADEDEDRVMKENLLSEIIGNKEKFQIFKRFLESGAERDIDNYIGTLNKLLDSRWKYFILEKNGGLEKKSPIPYSDRDSITLLDEIISYTLEMGEIKGKTPEEIFQKDFFDSKYLNCETREEKEQLFKSESFLDILRKKNPWNGTRTRGKDVEEILAEAKECLDDLRENLLVDVYNKEILPQENEILNFIGELYKTYDEMKFKDGKLTHTDVSTYTLEYYEKEELGLFTKDGVVSDYFQGVFNGRFKTLFIDEFQDTSILQWRLLQGISRRAENVICVGDEKQSLYSWRGGEKELFEKLETLIHGEVESLDTSYRSKKEIVDYTNKVFTEASTLYTEKVISDCPIKNLEEIDTWNFTPVDAKKVGDAYIEVKYLLDDSIDDSTEEKDNNNNESEIEDEENLKSSAKELLAIETLVKYIHEKFNGVYKGVAIIARNNKILTEIGKSLSDYNIPFTLKGKENLFDHRVNLGIKTLLNYLSTESFYRIVEILRSDLVKINEEELKEVFQRKDEIEAYLNISQDLKSSSELKIDCEKSNYERISSITEFIETLEFNNKKISETLLKIKEIKKIHVESQGDCKKLSGPLFKKFNPLKIYESGTDGKNYYRALEVFKEYDRVENFLIALRDNGNRDIFKQVSIEESNGITLITIHASKGLEYDTIIYYHKNSQNNRPDSLYFQLELDENFEKPIHSIIYRGKYHSVLKELNKKREDINYDFIEKGELKKFQEEINGWYVALTRPKNNLIIAFKEDGTLDKNGNEKEYSNNLFLDFVFKKMEKSCGTFSRKEIEEEVLADLKQEKTQGVLINFNEKETLQEELQKKSEKIDEFYNSLVIEDKNSRVIGTAVHYYLEHLEDLSEKSKEIAFKKTLSSHGLEVGVEKLKTILLGEKFKKELEKCTFIFDKTWDKIYNEYEVIDEHGDCAKEDEDKVKEKGKLKRIDRLMIKLHQEDKKGEICIIDYKTGGKDQAQLDGYEKIIKSYLEKEKLLDKYIVTSQFIMLDL